MAIFIVDITKEYNNQEWGNRYLVDAPDLGSAQDAGIPLAEQEKTFHSQAINFIQARVASLAANDGLYVTIPLSGTGALVVLNNLLPLQTVVMADIIVGGFGRPSRKYYHVGMDADSIHPTTPQHWATAILAAVDGGVAAMAPTIAALDLKLVDPDGQDWTETVRVDPKFRYHQFHKQSPRSP